MCCMTDSRLRVMAILLIPIAAVTQAIFPFLYNKLLFAGAPETDVFPVVLLWIRNLTVAGIGIGGAIVLWRSYREPLSDPSIPEPASP